MKRQTFAISLCGIFGALSIVIMLMGAIVPIAMYIAPAVAGLIVMLAWVECGPKMAWTLYGAVSIISLLFVPDKEVAFVYVFLLGYYPLIKPYLDKIRKKWLNVAVKLLVFNGALAVGYGLLMLLFFPGWTQIQGQISEILFAVGILLMGNVAFYLFDKAIANLLYLYKMLWQPKLHRMLRH